MTGRSLLASVWTSLRRTRGILPTLSDASPRYQQLGASCLRADCFEFGSQREFLGENRRSLLDTRNSGGCSPVGNAGVLSRPREWRFSSCGSSFVRPVVGPLQCALYSSVALKEPEVDYEALQAADIGYEVVGKCSSEGLRVLPKEIFAVVRVGSHQFKVTPGDMIYVEKLKFADINDKLLLSNVLMLGSSEQTVIGRPIIPSARVWASVEEIALDEKVIVFKKKRRKNYRRTNGHRQELTRLRILDIKGMESPDQEVVVDSGVVVDPI